MPGTSASVSSSIFVIENPSPTFSSFTVAPVWMRFGVMPARESCAVSAIVKQPAWAAPINSSGLVADWPASNRDLNEYGPSKAPLPTFSRPLPSARLPFHSASAFCVGMASLAMSKAFTHRGRQTRHRVTAVTPGPEPAGEWPHLLDSAPSEEERHTGARRLVGSRAIEDDLPRARDLVVPILQLLERHVQRARNDGRLGLEVQPVAHVHHQHVHALVEPSLEFLGRDPRDSDLPQEALAPDVLPGDVAGERGRQPREAPAPEAEGVLGGQLELLAEHPADGDERAGTQHAAQTAGHEELAERHPDDARQRRGDRAEAGDELGDEQRARATRDKNALGTAHTRVGLKRDAAQPAEHPRALGAADPVPDRVGQQRGDSRAGEQDNRIESTGAGQAAGGEQQRYGRNWQTDLLSEHRTEDHHIAVSNENADGAVHVRPPFRCYRGQTGSSGAVPSAQLPIHSMACRLITGLIWSSLHPDFSTRPPSGSTHHRAPCRAARRRGDGCGESARACSAPGRAAAGLRALRNNWPAPGDSDRSHALRPPRGPSPPCPLPSRPRSACPAR